MTFVRNFIVITTLFHNKNHTDFFNAVISLPLKTPYVTPPPPLSSGSKDFKTQTEVSWLTRMKLKRQSTSPIDTTVPPEKLRIVSERQRYNDAATVRYGSAGCGEFSRGVQH